MFDPIFEIAARPLFLARDARLLDPNEERKQTAGPEGLVTKIQHLEAIAVSVGASSVY